MPYHLLCSAHSDLFTILILIRIYNYPWLHKIALSQSTLIGHLRQPPWQTMCVHVCVCVRACVCVCVFCRRFETRWSGPGGLVFICGPEHLSPLRPGLRLKKGNTSGRLKHLLVMLARCCWNVGCVMTWPAQLKQNIYVCSLNVFGRLLFVCQTWL